MEEIVLVCQRILTSKKSMLTILEQGRIVAEERRGGCARGGCQPARRASGQERRVRFASGGNVTIEQLKQFMNEEQPW
ncbi:MAG: hypothetical protein R2843_16365 [Thermomicrobiales bacterium]